MITSLDPAKGFEVYGSGVMAQVYDRLLDFAAGKYDKPEPSLAESWKVSPDGLVWTFALRRDVKFHSGNPMTAEDVVYSFQRAVLLKDQPAFILTQFGLTPESIKALDPHTVQITLPKKYAGGLFLACMASIVTSVVDSKVVKQNVAKTDQFPNGDYGVTWLSRNSAGTGPFILRKWEKGDGVVLDANPNHFRYAAQGEAGDLQGHRRGGQPTPAGREGGPGHRLEHAAGPGERADRQQGPADRAVRR